MTNFDEKDYGPKPYVVNIEALTLENENFRTTKWTGEHLQMTVMAIPVGGDIGLEQHQHNDQFIRIEQGRGKVEMGQAEDQLEFVQEVEADEAVFVPAGAWHNITNIGDEPMKLYTIYGPKDHLPGTLHRTQEDARNDPNED
ncbi:cupin domain-containing protein [Lactococcus termiticola]|uniref:Cupin n=1 Tax=Lactococcus termiticola TaxID=2169526 RepID=A0A2R5HIG5_9LACT|nr:cupin domain-containing protein [Lactococcus termiticola]GBG97345.1 cupin [Lactococcus termiticola]